MNAIIQKYHKNALKVMIILLFILAVYVLFAYLLPFFAPFVIGIIISFMNEPSIKFLEKRLRIPRRAGSIIALVFTVSILGFLITFGIIKIYDELVVLKGNISDYISNTSIQIDGYLNNLNAFLNKLPYGVSNGISENFKSLAPKLQNIITSGVSYLIDVISSIPKMTVFIIVSILSAYFFSSDRNKINGYITKQFPNSWQESFISIKSDIFTAIFGYLKALLILMFITFVEVSIGLTLIGAKYALLIGLIVGLSDAIPILGTGVIMAPWIAWTYINGDTKMALSLMIIYLLGIIIRQLLEPKIIGNQIGLHPLATLLAMYIGLSLFGIIGMFIGPISIIVLKNLHSSGILTLRKG